MKTLYQCQVIIEVTVSLSFKFRARKVREIIYYMYMKKGDLGMAKRFPKCTETIDKLQLPEIRKLLSRCLSAPDATSLHDSIKNQQLKLIWFLC